MKFQYYRTYCLLSSFCITFQLASLEHKKPQPQTPLQIVAADFTHYYSQENLLSMLPILVAAGASANSSLDNTIKDKWQGQFRSKTTDRFFYPFKLLGERRSGFCFFILSFMKDAIYGGNTSNKYIRAVFVGALPATALSHSLGSDRPSNTMGNSHWKLGNRLKWGSVSGHAFGGAIPFLIIAEESKSQPIRVISYVLSTFTGLSRINDNRHYFSQTLLGWAFAYSAVKIVQKTGNNGVRVHISSDSIGLSVTF